MIVQDGILLKIEENDFTSDNILIIPDNVVQISEDALQSHIDIEGSYTLKIGKNLTENISFSQFYDAKAFIVHPDNPAFSSDEHGVLFNKDKTTLICCPKYNTYNSFSSTYEIPASVKKIGDFAFYQNNYYNVNISDSVQDIGKSAFAKSGIETVMLPKNLKTIGKQAFEYTKAHITVPSDIAYIGEHAFRGCRIQDVKFEPTEKNITLETQKTNGIYMVEKISSFENQMFSGKIELAYESLPSSRLGSRPDYTQVLSDKLAQHNITPEKDSTIMFIVTINQPLDIKDEHEFRSQTFKWAKDTIGKENLISKPEPYWSEDGSYKIEVWATPIIEGELREEQFFNNIVQNPPFKDILISYDISSNTLFPSGEARQAAVIAVASGEMTAEEAIKAFSVPETESSSPEMDSIFDVEDTSEEYVDLNDGFEDDAPKQEYDPQNLKYEDKDCNDISFDDISFDD